MIAMWFNGLLNPLDKRNLISLKEGIKVKIIDKKRLQNDLKLG